MPKRRREEQDEDRWRRKMRKYEKKIKKRNPRIWYSSEDEVVSVHDFQEPLLSQDLEYQEPDKQDIVNDHVPSEAPVPETFATAPSERAEAEIDPELLQALGDCHNDAPDWGNDILPDISVRWEPLFKTGLKKEIKEELSKSYLLPKNMQSSKAPTLNPEVAAMLTEAQKNRDSRLYKKQNQLGQAIAALGKAMTGIMTKKIDTPEILKILNDAGKLMVDSHYLETDTRRSLITPLLDKAYVAAFKDRKRDAFLFGDNLGEFIKSSRGIKKTGQLITPPVPSTSTTSTSLNWKGPPRQARFNRGGASRGGGQRAPPPAAASRRAPPPTAPRRAPPLPTTSNKRQSTQQSTSRSRATT